MRTRPERAEDVWGGHFVRLGSPSQNRSTAPSSFVRLTPALGGQVGAGALLNRYLGLKPQLSPFAPSSGQKPSLSSECQLARCALCIRCIGRTPRINHVSSRVNLVLVGGIIPAAEIL